MRLIKTRRARVALAVVFALTLVFGIAAAVYVGRAGVKGNLRAGAFQPEPVAVASILAESTASTCVIGINGGETEATVDMLAFPGDHCTFTTDVRLKTIPNSAPGKITGLTLVNLPVGWRAEILTGCGVSVTTTTTAQVKWRVTSTATAAADGSTTSIGIQSGVEAMPTAHAPAAPTCPAQTG